MNKVKNAQNKIIKLIYGSHHEDIYKMNGLFTFNNAYSYFALLKLYKELNNGTRSYLKTRVSSLQSNHSHYSRFSSQNSLVLPFYDLSKCQSSFLYKSINIWNYLPVHLKNETSYKFNRKLRNIC